MATFCTNARERLGLSPKPFPIRTGFGAHCFWIFLKSYNIISIFNIYQPANISAPTRPKYMLTGQYVRTNATLTFIFEQYDVAHTTPMYMNGTIRTQSHGAGIHWVSNTCAG